MKHLHPNTHKHCICSAAGKSVEMDSIVHECKIQYSARTWYIVY